MSKLFDFVIGNPPYQDESLGDNDSFRPAVYNIFMEESYSVANKVELIHPARFLFRVGSTPIDFDDRMLNDEHFKILKYTEDHKVYFPNAEIKGGIAISYRDDERNFGRILVFKKFEELETILKKVLANNFESITRKMVSAYAYHFTEKLYAENPQLRGVQSKGHEFDLKSNVFSTLSSVFYDKKPNDGKSYIRVIGRENKARAYKFIREDFLNTDVPNLKYYKAFMSGAQGNGNFGETLTPPFLGYPNDASTETFLSIGKCETEQEALNVIKYIKSKFARTMLDILRCTQSNTPERWEYVPNQDFTSTSDIDWNKPIKEIDSQLYKKYGLDADEIEFIENHVQEMS